ncbi:MAG: glycoside hydrolase domain-containing protein [Bacteroidota bacterium]
MKCFFSFLFSLFSLSLFSQSEIAIVQKASSAIANVKVSFASSSVRYNNESTLPVKTITGWKTSAWKAEKVHTQILVWGSKTNGTISVTVSDLKTKQGQVIGKQNISTGFVQQVMTDEFKGGCGYRTPADFDSSLVADIINTTIKNVALDKDALQPVWLSIKVPANAVAGSYTGTITVDAGEKYLLNVALAVVNKTLPPPAQWKYQLDLWQHPAAIARVHNETLWSDAHFASMKKYYTMLAAAGQKNITVSIVNEPWGHQTYDDYPSLVKWTKKKDGGWSYDYSLFDKYVSFVMSCGITDRINCYSMVPWKIAFAYYDEALGKDTVFTQAIGTPAYNEFWSVMLKDFTAHLKNKGWFNITAIAMDERPLAAMQAVIALLKSVDKDWKLTLAGDYHEEIENDIDDYCVASRWKFPAEILAKRKKAGKISTWYTCCTEAYPNGFTFSPPDEHVWIGWYTAATNMDGYLRWAFNSWTKDPLKDSRFTAWPAGDTYQVYPGPLSSIRFEKLIEGIQDHEKILLLRNEYRCNKQTAKLQELQAALKNFEISKLSSTNAAEMMAAAKGLLNK